jgi:signal transduction histidine kinase
MKTGEVRFFNRSRLGFTFTVLICLILGGNGLIIWQFRRASLQTERVASVNQQVVAALQLQVSLLYFHRRLDELTRPNDARFMAMEAEPLRTDLLDRLQQTRFVLTNLPSNATLNPGFLPTLEAIEIAMPSQIEAITALAQSGDWESVHLRLATELRPLETQTSALVKSIDQDVSVELQEDVANMNRLQRETLLIVPTTAIFTFCIAAFFGWSVTRRIVQLRLEERVNERTRIARELHDTLLQGVFSASMQLHLAVDQLPADSAARPMFARPVQILAQVMEEGRQAIRGFRSIERGTQDLERAFSILPQELHFKEEPDFTVRVTGRPLSMPLAVNAEVYSIGREALVNSFRHSGATRIEVELGYSATEMRMVVRDDGCGIDPRILEYDREGHWGLAGMRERAARIGAELKIFRRAEGGTEVVLYVPGDHTLQPRPAHHAPKWLPGLYVRRVAKGMPTAKESR